MIRLSHIGKALGGVPVLRDVSLHVARGEFLALLGASGSGKTTLLRLVAGLEQPDSGALFIDGQPAARMPPGKRRAGFVFQNYALFGHMTAFENIAFGLRARRPRMARAEIAGRVDALLAMVRLDGLGPRLPQQLSGGQRQRVALARALAIEPRILLLDEPFGALDRTVREELREELRRLHRAFGITTVFVTHDQEEALSLADRVVIMQSGRIAADLPGGALLDGPVSGFNAHLLGRGLSTAE